MHAEEEGVLKLERGEQALFLAQAAQRFELLVHGARFQEIVLDLRELFDGEGHIAVHRAEAAAVVAAPLRHLHEKGIRLVGRAVRRSCIFHNM